MRRLQRASRTATGHVVGASLSSPLGFSPAGVLQSSAEKIDAADESAVGGGRLEGPSFSPCGSSSCSDRAPNNEVEMSEPIRSGVAAFSETPVLCRGKRRHLAEKAGRRNIFGADTTDSGTDGARVESY
ncbi:hypothetical protein HPB50_021437 [Hyalomma asiaticum]|uniref:Uncharacterized protein n=1 Tax=Hyalomma asiaticum TaxID=266040 RepID=A0ACB7TR00_HYAAI|nr:hypothetical protein HPB50_021437 [Hyalomma asiaticum]